MKTEAFISKERAQAQQYLDVAGVMLAVLDKNGKINLINKKGCQILGYDENKILHQNWFDLCIHDDIREDIVGVFNKLMTGNIESVKYFENPIITKSGEKKIIAFHNTLIMDDDSNITGILFSGEDITERKRAEEALRVSEQNFHDLVENLMDGVAIADENAYHIYVNPKFSEITGYSRDELLNMSGWDFTPPEEIDKLKQRMKDRIAGKTVQTHYDRTIVKKDGTKIPVEMSSTVTIWQGKKRPLAIIHDITERKKAEGALRAILDASPDIIHLIDNNGIILSSNESFAKRVGLEIGDVVGKSVFDYTPNKSVHNRKAMIDKVFKTGVPLQFEDVGLISTFESHIHPIFNQAGEVTAVAVYAHDITERKQAEVALQESEHRLLRAQEVAHVGDWEFDVKTGVSVWSDEIYSIYGFDPANEIESKTMLAGMHPDDLDYVNEKFAVWIKNGCGEPFEYRIVRPDGSIRHVYSPAEVVRDSNGNVVKVYGTALDITDRKNAEESLKIYVEELARSNEELKSLDKMKDEFLSNVSHELKTPLISIKGFSEVVQDELYGPLNDQQKNAMSTVIRNSERLGRLINSILYLTIQKSGRDTYTIHPIDITEIIGNALIDISPQANSKELTIENNTPSDLPLIKGDMDKLTQVFINLFENATKFTPNGGKITVAAFEDSENVHITVSDTGIGISDEVISNLFDKFYQVDASTTRRYGGTGIGLYISKLIVEVHNGEIWAESEEGIGTTFHIMLPK